jgi:hypothetical protein
VATVGKKKPWLAFRARMLSMRYFMVLALLLASSTAWADHRFRRRPSDEKLFTIPTALTMRPGALSVSDDEVIFPRAAIGLGRVQLDLRVGGFPIPGAAGGALPLPGGIAAGGGAGVLILGAFDLGLKVRILDEGPSRPGVAVAYDLVDMFGIGVGGAGIALAGSGLVAGGVVAVGGANIQFNLFTVTAAKHFGPHGRRQVVFGSYLLDNHHYLPQSANFVAACGAGGAGDAGAGGVVLPCAGSTKTINILPTQVQPFVGIEQVVGRENAFVGELLVNAGAPKQTFGTTGFRWILNPKGLVKMRIDIALIWTSRGVPLPWLGAGFHFR